MKVIGINLKRPRARDVMLATVMAAINLVISLAILGPLGGSAGQVAGLTGIGFIVTLLSACGNSFEEVGLRSFGLAIPAGAITFAAIVGVFAVFR
jgi:hypothetical protein